VESLAQGSIVALCWGYIILDSEGFTNKNDITFQFAAFISDDQFWESVGYNEMGECQSCDKIRIDLSNESSGCEDQN
jgi:hypothetical protein